MSALLQDASNASASPIVEESHNDSSWKGIAEHFAKPCLCRRGTILPRCPTEKARGAPQFHGWHPTTTPVPRPPHSHHCSRVCHKPPPRVYPHPSPAPGKPSPRLHHRDAPPPAKYPPCSVHPALSAAPPFESACYPAPQPPHKSASPAPNRRKNPKAITSTLAPFHFSFLIFAHHIATSKSASRTTKTRRVPHPQPFGEWGLVMQKHHSTNWRSAFLKFLYAHPKTLHLQPHHSNGQGPQTKLKCLMNFTPWLQQPAVSPRY